MPISWFKSRFQKNPPGDLSRSHHPMNILVSSTRQWNAGDEFIRFGVLNLFDEIIKDRRINWILYDRNPDLNTDGFRNRVHRDEILGNSFHGHDPHAFDMAVIAGTPEWFGPPMEPFYEAVKAASLPLLILGAGYIDAPIVFSDDELYCLKRLSKVIITRDEYASRALKEAGIDHHLLPCPALFASRQEQISADMGRIGFIIQSSKTVNQLIPSDLTARCIEAVRLLRSEGYQIDVLCHYIDEFAEFARTLSPVRYSYDARDYIDIVEDYDIIISTRLHGAILANSLGRPAILLNDDSRCSGSASLFPFIYPSKVDEIRQKIASLDMNHLKTLPAWKAQIKTQYLDILRIVLMNMAPSRRNK
jgi:hypothetical protein